MIKITGNAELSAPFKHNRRRLLQQK